MHRGELNAAVDHGANTVSPLVTEQRHRLGACGVFARFTCDGSALLAGSADGRITVLPSTADEATSVELGAMPLCVARYGTHSLLVGTDDGRVLRVAAGEPARTVHAIDGAWIEQLAVDQRVHHIAVAAGREVTLLAGEGRVVRRFGNHPSTPTGLRFGPRDESLAVSHYDGVTVWDLAGDGRDKTLHWHGSHTRLSWSPCGGYIATATQDNELHAWRMPEGKSLKMSGYPAKIRSLSWTRDGRYLACAGADTVTCWNFAGNGPEGSAPMEFGYVYNSLVSAVAAHPERDVVAAGYDNGSVLVGEIASGEALIVRAAGDGRAVALDWAPDGRSLAVLTEGGMLSLLRFAPDAFAA